MPNTRSVANEFSTFYSNLLDKEILSKKTKTTQDKYLKIKTEGLQFIKTNDRAIYMTVASYMNLQKAKKLVISQLSKVNTFGTFLKTDDGYKVTAPEGFVAIKSGNALKLVDRLEFSKANFTIAKDWDKG
jgi:histidyl-tRNA synthetase